MWLLCNNQKTIILGSINLGSYWVGIMKYLKEIDKYLMLILIIL